MASAAAGTVDLGWWTITPEWVDTYLEATGDDWNMYRELEAVPPLALAARTLGTLLEKLALPPGAIHGAQEIQCLRAAQVGERVRLAADLARPAQRGDLRFITAAFTVQGEQGDAILTGKSTVILPPEGDGGGGRP